MRLPLTITRAGFSYLFVMSFVLAVAVLREINLLFMIAGLMVGPLLFNAIVAILMPRRIVVRRSFPPAVSAGELFTVHISATNNRRRGSAWLIVVEDTIARVRGGRLLRSIAPTAWLPQIPAGAQRHTEYRGRIAQRGRYRFGAIRLISRFPLGLFARTITLHEPTGTGESNEFLVYPRIGRLTGRARRLWSGSAQGARRSQRKGRAENEFHGLRNWQRGDSRRLIHWRSTARRGEIVVREFEHLEQQDLAVVLDLARLSPSVARNGSIIERGVESAATLVAEFAGYQGARVMLAIAGEREVCVNDSASARLREEMLAALAEAEPALLGDGAAIARQDQRIAELVQQAERNLRPGTPIIVLAARQAAPDSTMPSAAALSSLSNSSNLSNSFDSPNATALWRVDVARGEHASFVELASDPGDTPVAELNAALNSSMRPELAGETPSTSTAEFSLPNE